MNATTSHTGRFHPCRHPIEFVVFEESPRRVREVVDLPCATCFQKPEVIVPELALLNDVTRWRGDEVKNRPSLMLRRFVKTHRPDLGPLEQLAVTCGMPAVYWKEA